ncbi:MAG: hypothetical protein LBD60_02785 [Puniceicoccales bacterium]|jgi:metal-dependent hydrolase (beta-lactamase superfamily II)|nr:hypothetical protein [Puniceicoccales bacterium]
MFGRLVVGLMFCYVNIVLAIQKSPLEIVFFNTGQGNLIAVRANDVNPRTQKVTSKLIFIDCGSTLHAEGRYGKILRNEQRPQNEKLGRLFENITDYGILITHNHADHTNLIEAIREISKKGGRRRLVIVRPLSRDGFDAEDPNKRPAMLKKDWENFCYEDLPCIENSLGPRVRVVPMRPERWKDNGAQNPEHDFNIMYLVEFAGRRILFPGDVSPQLFTQIMNVPKYRREIAAVDFLVLPHHGTNRAGELLTFFVKKPEMCIICSNPNEQQSLPWLDVSNFQFKRWGSVTVREHNISMGMGKRDGESARVVIRRGVWPLFATCNAKEGYYELVVEADGKATLFDGSTAKRGGNFCFQSS